MSALKKTWLNDDNYKLISFERRQLENLHSIKLTNNSARIGKLINFVGLTFLRSLAKFCWAYNTVASPENKLTHKQNYQN